MRSSLIVRSPILSNDKICIMSLFLRRARFEEMQLWWILRTMSHEPLLPRQILDVAEGLLRRHGVEKTNVVDIAKVLGMSHGNIYRHYSSKKAILDAVAARWLHAISSPLGEIAGKETEPAGDRLVRWFNALRTAKRHKVLDDPELFRVYHSIVSAMREVVGNHVAELAGQVEKIIGDGVKSGEFRQNLDPAKTARAFFQSTAAFHHPALILQDAPTDEEADLVMYMLMAGIRAIP